MHLLIPLMGAGIVALVHGSKTAVRVAVTPSPEAVSNLALSGSEDIAAIALTWVATRHPLAAGGTALVAVVVCILAVRWTLRRLRVALHSRAWLRASTLL